MGIPSLQEIQKRAPPNTNPFRFVDEVVKKALHPQTPNCTAPALLFFGVVCGANILICLAILIIPLHRGPAAKKKYQTPWSRQYVPGSKSRISLPIGQTLSLQTLIALTSIVISKVIPHIIFPTGRSPFSKIWPNRETQKH